MKQIKRMSIYLLSNIFLIILLILITTYPEFVGMCASRYTNEAHTEFYGCFRIKAEPLVGFIGFLTITLLPLLLILLFCKETAYRSWKKFSLWYFGIVGLLLSPIIIDTLLNGFAGGSGGELMSNPASIGVGEDVLILGLYFFLSLIVIIRGQLRNPKAVTGKK